MSIDLKYGRCCDGCGRAMEKAHRIHGKLEFCGSCYPREFVPTPCTMCNAMTRVYRLEIRSAKCRSCTVRERRCLRCDKPMPKAGLRVGDRFACASCAFHFCEPRPCANCGALAKRLSRSPKYGFEQPVCDKCRRNKEQITCSSCNMSRPPAKDQSPDTRLCQGCFDNPGARHDCPGCGTSLPGIGTGRCRSCLNRDGVNRTTALKAASLEHPWCRSMTQEFGEWLWKKQTDQPALVTHAKKHMEFFAALDAAFDDVDAVTAEAIAAKLSVPFLRKHLLCRQFLAERYELVLDATSQRTFSEQHQIQKKLTSLALKPYGNLLTEYEAWLSAGDVVAHTRRLYLRAAENLCIHASLSPNAFLPDALEQTQARFQSFVRKHPGSRASAGRFVRYLNGRLGVELRLPAAKDVPARKPAAVNRLGMLMRAIKTVGLQQTDDFSLLRIVGIALGFTDLKMRQIEACRPDGAEFTIAAEVVTIPKELRPFAQELARRFLAQGQIKEELM